MAAVLVSRVLDILSQMRSTRRSNTTATLTSSFADDSKNSRPTSTIVITYRAFYAIQWWMQAASKSSLGGNSGGDF